MGRGRPPKPGKVFYLGRLRYDPRYDPPELRDLLEQIEHAGGRKRADIIKSALLSGANQAMETANNTEDTEIAGMMDDLLGGF